MFGIGLPELAVLAFIGVVVFGPDKLPELARQSAHLVRRVKDMADGARDELRSQLGDDYADLELRDLDPRAIVRRHITSAFDDQDASEAGAVDDVDGADNADTLAFANEAPAEAAHAPTEHISPRSSGHPWLSEPAPPPSLLRRSRHNSVRKPRATRPRTNLTNRR